MSKRSDAVEEAIDQIVKQIVDDDQYKSFFTPYTDDSVSRFIKTYARYKANQEVYGEYVENNQHSPMAEWRNGAWQCLREIQHKKLFDISCQWQAEEIKDLPGIEASYDFREIGEHILDYTGISPISEEELNFCMEFLREEKNALDYYSHDFEYQDQDELKSCFEEDMKTGIAYYDYHNTHTGNARLLKLPTIRMEKEHEYIRYREEKTDIKPKAEAKKIEKPDLRNEEEELIAFARKFNDPATASYIEDWLKYRNNQMEEADTWALGYVNRIYPDNIQILANQSWLNAIYEAAMGHKQGKILELLPSIYEEYLMKKSAGILIDAKDNDESTSEKWYRELILDGRERKGEPRNFNF